MIILMLFVRTRLCGPAKKLAKIVEKFDEKTSSFPSKFRPRNPISVEKIDDKTSCFSSKISSQKPISIRNWMVYRPQGTKFSMIILMLFHRNLLEFRLRKCISYTNFTHKMHFVYEWKFRMTKEKETKPSVTKLSSTPRRRNFDIET